MKICTSLINICTAYRTMCIVVRSTRINENRAAYHWENNEQKLRYVISKCQFDKYATDSKQKKTYKGHIY